MRVLIAGAGPRPAGWANVLAAAGNPCTVWDGVRPAFDAFDEANPDLFVAFGPGSRAIDRCLEGRPGTRKIGAACSPPAFDSLRHRPGTHRPELACDVTFWGSPSAERLAYLRPLIAAGLRVKVFGPGDWGIPQHLGWIAEGTIPDLVASAKVCVDQGQGGRDTLIMGLGGLCVATDRPLPPRPAAGTPEGFLDLVAGLVAAHGSGHLAQVRRAGQEAVRAGHTYFHRAAAALRGIGLVREADRVMEQFACS